MDNNNISYQLFVKQLPNSSKASSFNCNTYESIKSIECTDNEISDSDIELAFQNQLDLSEFYKTPLLIDSLRQEFRDSIMDLDLSTMKDFTTLGPSGPSGPSSQASQSGFVGPPKNNVVFDVNNPALMNDIYNSESTSKEGFGAVSGGNCYLFITVLILLAIVIIILLKVKE